MYAALYSNIQVQNTVTLYLSTFTHSVLEYSTTFTLYLRTPFTLLFVRKYLSIQYL